MTAPSELVDVIAGVLAENGITDPEYRAHVAQAVADALAAEGTVTTEWAVDMGGGVLDPMRDADEARSEVARYAGTVVAQRTITTPWREVES